MFSGTGRHRRPRQAPAFVVTAGATTAGLALPLLGTGAAQAADGAAVDEATWERVAECESSGEWAADRGNGFYGGLQLPLTLWEEFGGEEFAERPDLASRTQQIAVAERILAEQGPGAFPACALLSGLTEEYRAGEDLHDRSAEEDGAQEDGAEEPDSDGVDPEESGKPEDRDRSGADGGTPEDDGAQVPPSDDHKQETDSEADGENSPDPGQNAEEGDGAPGGATEGAAPGRSEEDSPGSGQHRGEPAPDDAERTGERSGRHAAAADGTRHEVRQGETLSAIAVDHRVSGGWPALYAANADLVGEDPDHIVPGQPLVLPDR